MFNRNQNRILLVSLVVFVALVYFLGLFVDVAGDAGKYAAISKNIFHSGDWINLTIHGDPYREKPPLLFWLGTLGYYLFGINNFGYKFFPVLYAFFGVYCVYRLGESLYTKRIGRLAALLIAFSEIYFLYNVDVHTDMVLMTNVVFALWQLYDYLQRKKALNFVLGFFAVGLAIMTKGPIGAFVPAMAVATYLVSQKKFIELVHPKWLLGILIAVVTASPAFVGLYQQFGMEGLKFFFWTNNFGRIAGTYVVRGNTDYFFYLHTLLYMYAPWSLVLFVALFFEFKDLVKKRFSGAEYFLFGGTWFFFVILTIAKGKSPNYMLILIPLLTIVMAKWLSLFWEDPKSKLFKVLSKMQVVMVVLLWVCILLFNAYLFPSKNVAYWLLIIAAIGVTYYIYRKNKEVQVRFLAPSMLVIALVGFSFNAHILPVIFQYQSSVVATRKYNELSKPGEHLYNYDYEQFELFFYGKDDVKLISDTTMLDSVCHIPGSWIFCYDKGLNDIKRLNAPIDTIYKFKHRGIYRTGIKFILPSSRAKTLRNTYLVKTK
ncbi:MAG TPA: glycosyltransferase family 39 protein [Sunxiuqinia sp.]|nr:glycosyltransferase family 39 protein [Sunxiuqinia sp.]